MHTIKNQRGFQVPAALGIMLALIVVSTTLVNTVRNSQYQYSAEKEYESAKLLATNAILEAESTLLDSKKLPFMTHSISQRSTVPTGSLEVWSPTLDDYELLFKQDGFTDRSIDWWDQGSSWWQDKATKTQAQDNSRYIIEYSNRVTAGQDIGQQQEYKGDGLRLLFRITGSGFSSRHAKAVKQTTFSKVYYGDES